MEIVAMYARDVLLNSILASGVVPVRLRVWLYRLLGVGLHPTARVMPGCFIGGRNLRVGAGTWIYYGCHLDTSADIVLEDHVALSTGVRLVTASHDIGPSGDRLGPDRAAPIRIGEGAWIGIGAMVLSGVSVGPGCVIAAGAVVSRDCPPNGLYVGNPARRLRELDADRTARVGPKHHRRRRSTWESSRQGPLAGSPPIPAVEVVTEVSRGERTGPVA